ncbi:MAG TPA: hypothetical protein DCK76_02475 [Desulfotomaculum sp.]|nr:MAG: hypothetical protein XD75_0228 [Parcubacteria bacterium 33_209]HAG10261.1 hypothetical protein [Desulfotomaculum sp.]HBY04332.1 hypothetical protein [Desulfotomaculum sp.]
MKKIKEEGFTIIELMVGLFILSIIVIIIASYYTQSSKVYVYTMEQTKINQEAQKVLSEIVDGKNGDRNGLRYATTYDISTTNDSIAFQNIATDGVTLIKKGYRLGAYTIYKVDNLASVIAPTTGGTSVSTLLSGAVTTFNIITTSGVSTGDTIIRLEVGVDRLSKTGFHIGGTLDTEVKPRGL